MLEAFSGTPRLLFLSDIPWHSLHQRPQHLALRMARRWPVLWVEPATLGHARSWKPERVAENIHKLSVPLLPHNARSTAIKRAAWAASALPVAHALLSSWQQRVVCRALEHLGDNSSPLLVLMENFQLVGMVDVLHASKVCFDYIDDAFGFVEMPDYVRDLWVQAIRRSDVITVTTHQLQERIQSVRQDNIHVVPNGVEYSHFSPRETPPRPGDLPPPGTPIAGYVGSVYPWFDFDLLRHAAERFPKVNFVIIGPQHPEIQDKARSFGTSGNVLFLGRRPYAEVPAYLHHFSIGLIPFLRNTLTEAVNPVKLYEYCAVGLPTVSTLFSDDLLEFRNLIHVTTTVGDFLNGLSLSIAESRDHDFTDRLKAFAHDNDWDVRGEKLISLLGSG